MQYAIRSSGKTVALDRSSKQEGGQGAVYWVQGHSDLAAKIFNGGAGTSEEKLQVMLRAIPGRRNENGQRFFAWPEEILVDQNRQVVGYLMPRVDGVSLWDIILPNRREKKQPRLDRKGLYQIGIRLSKAVEVLHGEGHAANDLQPQNVLVTRKGVVLIDCDSFEVLDRTNNRVFVCPVGLAKYIPPEYQGMSVPDYRGGEKVDRFALAVLLFQLLMQGGHPFSGVYQDDENRQLGGRIADGVWPYAPSTQAKRPPRNPPLKVLPPVLRQHFRQCFMEGHRIPSKRPEPGRWRHLLEQVRPALQRCQGGHYFGPHLSKCPWCGNRAESQNGSPGSGHWLDKYRSRGLLQRAAAKTRNWFRRLTTTHTQNRNSHRSKTGSNFRAAGNSLLGAGSSIDESQKLASTQALVSG
jgi:DNA-binding helix-hairpin-helix protein with protein kinase domain